MGSLPLCLFVSHLSNCVIYLPSLLCIVHGVLCVIYVRKWQLRMAIMECSMVIQRATALFLSLLCFVSLPCKQKTGRPRKYEGLWFLLRR